MNSKISFSKGVWIISILTSIGIIACLIFLGNDIFLRKNYYDIINIILFFLVILAYMASLYFMPKSLLLTSDKLVIQCLIHRVHIPLSNIAVIETTQKHKDFTNIRVFGNGGLWGYTGIFRNEGVGKYIAYVGNPKQAFYIRLKSGRNYLVSCDNYLIFLEKLSSLTSKSDIG